MPIGDYAIRDAEDSPEYLAYLADLEAQEQRATQRAGKPYPMEWGAPLDPHRYFCGACWASGDETGAHPYDQHPCDPPGMVRNPYDPR